MTRLGAALSVLALVSGALAVAFTWQPGLASLYDDSASYLLMAQAMSPWHAAAPAVAAAAAHEKYPPLFPLLLALTGGAYDWRLAHSLVAAAFGASVLLLGLYARRITDSAGIGFAAALVYALMPGVWLNVKGILSEFPFIALALASLLFHARYRDRRLGLGDAAVLGLLLSAAFLTRTIGLALLLAVAVSEGVRHWRAPDAQRARRLGISFAIVIAASLAWYLLRPSAGEDAYASYGGRVAAAASEDGMGFLVSIMAANASAMTDAWFNALLIFWGEPWRPAFVLASAIGAVGLGGMAVRAWRGEADGLYVCAFIAMLLVWPFPGQMFRLAFPLVPMVWLGFLWAWRHMIVRWSPETGAQRAPYVAVLPLVLCVPAVLFYIVERARMTDLPPAASRVREISEFYRIPSGPVAASNAMTQLAVFADMERIREATPDRSRVMWYTPAYVALLAQRPGVVLERPKDPSDLEAQVRDSGADYVYLSVVHPRDSAHRLGNPLMPALFLRPYTEEVWHRANGAGDMQAVLLKVRRDKLAPGPAR